MTSYDATNESVRLSVISQVPPETRSALAAFFRRNGYPHVFHEVLEPLLSGGAKLTLALATSDRPWPPKGIGSQTIDAVGIAMIGREGRGLLTPVLLDRSQATNVGIAGALTKQLLEALRDKKVSSVVYLVREDDRVLERALERAGFAKGDLLTATEFADYREHSATPAKALEALGLKDTRVSDVLSLRLDGQELDRLSGYVFVLGAGLSPYLADLARFAALLPGLIDVIADSPPGGVPPGSGGPSAGQIGGGEL